jgi:trigger factor
MKTELTDVTETQKTITIEIPSDVVDAEINRIARGYTKQAKLPGFRPGKVPQTIVKQRFREQILHDVMHGLIPRAVEEALQERGIEPVDTPNIRDVALEEGQPLKFTAAIETVPPFDPGDLASISLRPQKAEVTDDMIEETMKHLRERAAKYETVDSRPVTDGDTALVDLHRTMPGGELEHHHDISVDMNSPANPPGFAANLIGLNPGDEKTFTIHFPASYPSPELADKEVTYSVKLKSIHTKTLPELDDEFAKDLGDFASLDALKTRVREDLAHEAKHESDRELRADLMKQLATRVTFEVPQALLEREIDRRVEEFVRRLIDQQIDPMKTNINWEDFREKQREAAAEAVRGALVLDEVARREAVTVSRDEIEAEIAKYAERTGRTPAAVRARLEKEGGIGRLYSGLRRERAIDFLLSRATIEQT